ncbi:MAG TPA: VTT domain-containing protein [Caulobacteraceae bacterium]|jgi:membrane protein YqaA with SNARE-associated domain|nr:VTT domain-containing protein [Caulobacteraceae bacterium]
MLRALYDRVLALAATAYALPALAGVAVVEATFPFAPPDLMLAPMVLARRERAWLYAAVATAGSVTGGMIGYAIGFFLSGLGLRILALSGHAGALSAFHVWFAQWGLAVILIKGLTPVPYMLVTLASGIAHFSFPVFVGASIVTRGGRFFLEAALLQHPKAKAVIDRYFYWLAGAGVVLILAAFILLRLLGGG